MKRQMLVRILQEPLYTSIVLGIATFLMVLLIWVQQWSLIRTVINGGAFGLVDSLVFLLTLLTSVFTNFIVFSLVTTLAIAVLVGILTALMAYSYRRNKRQSLAKQAAVGGLGISSGAIGLGCAACGSLILSGLGSSIGLASIALFLPFGGKELTLLSISILMFAINQQLRALTQSNVCQTT